MDVLRRARGRAWFVGGCVRDSLLHGQADDFEVDIDIATDLVPEQVVRQVSAAGLKAIPTGIAHGTVTVIVDGRSFEVTTLREDVETDGRNAQVAFGCDLAKDAARRDFTINALYARADGMVVDPLGGLADLAARRVRFVGDADRRILEDHLRILRFFRFYARFGDRHPDPAGLAACIRHRDRLTSLSAERIAAELFKLLMADQPVPALRAMQHGGILTALGLAGAEPDRLDRLLALDQPTDALLRLAALFRSDRGLPGRGRQLAERLRLSASQRDRLEGLLGRPLVPLEEPLTERHRRWYREGSTIGWRDRFLLAAAINGDGRAILAPALAAADIWTRPRFPLTGDDLLARGVSPGARVGQVLRSVETWWLALDTKPDRAACLAELDRCLRLDAAEPST